MRKLIILVGPAGGGKTTWAATHYPLARFVSANSYFERDGEYAWDARFLQTAHDHCWKEFQHEVDHCDTDIVVDNTNLTEREFRPYYEYGKANDMEPLLVLCGGEFENVHGVPADTVAKQRAKYGKLRRDLAESLGYAYIKAL